jgi:uncharacterized repeat protein (TIGR01451 family)
MKCKRLIQRIISFVLAWLFIFNYCDIGILRLVGGLVDAEAAITLSANGVKSLWVSNSKNFYNRAYYALSDEVRENLTDEEKSKYRLVSDDGESYGDGMWADTSKDKLRWIDAEKVTEGTTTDGAIGVPITYSGELEDVTVEDSTDVVSSYAYNGDESGKLDNEDVDRKLYYTVEYDSGLNGYYRRYYISTANQLMYLLYNYQNDTSNWKTSANEIKRQVNNRVNTSVLSKVGITLLCDIDLGGSSGGMWAGKGRNAKDYYLDIDGVNNYIYNGYFIADKYFLRNKASRFAIQNVTFSNAYIGRMNGIFGTSITCAYFNNVNFEYCVSDSFADDTTTAKKACSTIMMGSFYYDCYVKDCCIMRSYVHGEGHSSTFASYNNTKAAFVETETAIEEGSEPDDSKTYYYTEIPEELGEIERAWKSKNNEITKNSAGYKLMDTNTGGHEYPSIYENSMAIECEIYDTDVHSGTFVSCITSRVIFRNCFTNSTIYSRTKSGVFLGACIGACDGFYYSYNGEKKLVNSIFENCYTSGSIEGTDEVGGFVGTVYSDGENSSDRPAGSEHRGVAVFKSCYSTSSVGMIYAGNNLGGFIGSVVGNIRDEKNITHIFDNCYAAGEVGNIRTITSLEDSNGDKDANTESVGGFVGSYYKAKYISDKSDIENWNEDGDIPINATNCYYDMQTTGMRERDIGSYNTYNKWAATPSPNTHLYGTVDGITGVYTERSDKKGVAGLSTDSLMEGGWIHKDGYYPMLSVFESGAFGSKEKNELAKQCSLASTATVFLDHYDEMLNDKGEKVDAGATIYDTVRDITSKFEFTSEYVDDRDVVSWATDTIKNGNSGYRNRLGNADNNNGNTGFTLDYSDSNNSNLTHYFNPKVLTIQRIDNKYKCLDFAPGKQWVEVTAASEDGKITGTRSLRLLPTAYINAGGMMHINVIGEGKDLTNTVSYTNGNNEVNLNGKFNHSVGVAYAITSRNRMLGSSSKLSTAIEVYNNGILTQYYSEYTASATNADKTYCFYSKYAIQDGGKKKNNVALIGENSGDGDSLEITGMLSQNFGMKTSAKEALRNLSYSDSSTMVRIYKAKVNDKTYAIDMKEEITYNADNIKKWQGDKLFDNKDDGYYYLEYLWRLSDGRYLSDYKLVRVTLNYYTVDMKTGILEQEHEVDDKGDTPIDHYVTDSVTKADDGSLTPNGSYPSSKSDFSTDTAATYYDTYNIPEEYSDSVYYTKSNELATRSASVAVGWRRTTDYKLTTLIVEAVDQYGITHQMARIDNLPGTKNTFSFENAEYEYQYTTYKITQDEETKLFTVVPGDPVPIRFKVRSINGSVVNSIENYIVFDFETSSDDDQQVTYADEMDSLKVTALFRLNTADVVGEKSVLLNPPSQVDVEDTDTYVSELDSDGSYVYDTYDYYSLLSNADKAYEVDNSKLADTDYKSRKAVLGGDELTYRVKLKNEGFFESDVVNVYDTVPEGSEYVADSMKIYRQGIYTGKTDQYKALEQLDTVNTSLDANGKPIRTSDGVYYVAPPDTSGNMAWSIPSMPLDYIYFVEYRVKVDDLAAKIKSGEIVNTATWDFLCRNGDVESEYDDADNLEELKKNEIFSISMQDANTAGDSGNIRTYTIDFNPKSAESKQYNDIEFTDTFESLGFTLDSESFKVYKLSEGGVYEEYEKADITTADGYFTVTGFSIKSASDKYRIVFSGTQSQLGETVDGKLVDEISNKVSITYATADNSRQGNSVAQVERLSNEVETDVTHLYLTITKNIPDADSEQAFLFKIERYDSDAADSTADGCIYTEINCDTKYGSDTEDSNSDSSDNGGYTGSKVIELNKRGYYKVSELTDWSNTDYDFVSSSYKDSYSGYSTDSDSIVSSDNSVGVPEPRLYYISGAHPTSLGVEYGDVADLYNTEVIFNNKPSEYAWLSSQSNVVNELNYSDDTTVTVAAKAARRTARGVPEPEDTVTSTAAIITTVGGTSESNNEEEKGA